jgi:hypothetical protein
MFYQFVSGKAREKVSCAVVKLLVDLVLVDYTENFFLFSFFGNHRLFNIN